MLLLRRSLHRSSRLLSQHVAHPGDGKEYCKSLGYDPLSFLEQQIVWGDLDSFRHVNNVRYIRFFESSRMKWASSIGEDIGGLEKAKAMMEAQGVSFILKSINVKFKRPVTYPDTLLIAHKPHNLEPTGTQFHLDSVAYSYAQKRVVCEADAVIVWYDYDKWQKCVPPPEMAAAVQRRVK